jgi:hypothetical protein
VECGINRLKRNRAVASSRSGAHSVRSAPSTPGPRSQARTSASWSWGDRAGPGDAAFCAGHDRVDGEHLRRSVFTVEEQVVGVRLGMVDPVPAVDPVHVLVGGVDGLAKFGERRACVGVAVGAVVGVGGTPTGACGLGWWGAYLIGVFSVELTKLLTAGVGAVLWACIPRARPLPTVNSPRFRKNFPAYRHIK